MQPEIAQLRYASPQCSRRGVPTSNSSRTWPLPAPCHFVTDSLSRRKTDARFCTITFIQPHAPFRCKIDAPEENARDEVTDLVVHGIICDRPDCFLLSRLYSRMLVSTHLPTRRNTHDYGTVRNWIVPISAPWAIRLGVVSDARRGRRSPCRQGSCRSKRQWPCPPRDRPSQ